MNKPAFRDSAADAMTVCSLRRIDERGRAAWRLSPAARLIFAISLVILVNATGQAQNTVVDWNEHAANAIAGVAGQPPPRGMIRMAMVHLAMYDAVNAIEGNPFEPYGVRPHLTLPASAAAAAAAAAHDVLVALFPAQRADLDAKYATSLAAIPDGPAKTNGVSAGQETAAGILLLRADDGRDQVVVYVPGSGPGIWIPAAPASLPAQAPEVAQVRPWALHNPSQFRAEPPPRLKSKLWVRDYNEVRSLGAATGSSRTAEQTDIGRFWTDQPILQWNRAWHGISLARGLSLMESARFFAMLTVASSDALIACWDSKFNYNFWRPVTAIRAGDTDGRSGTEPEPAWLPLAATPPHPEYPSAHSCFSGAVTYTLKSFFGTDTFNFTIDSTIAGLASPVRQYFSFSQAREEVMNARIYGGMHYRNSTDAGAIIAKQVSRFVTKHFFRPSR